MQKITIYHKYKGVSKTDDARVDRIEYGGQSIEFRDGKIRVKTVEEPAKPARRPNMPAGMQL